MQRGPQCRRAGEGLTGISGLRPIAYWSVEADVSAALPFGPGQVMRGWVCGPAAGPTAGITFYCLAGGRCSTRYFDLHVDGHTDYSMAEYLARRGFIVIALDHPGIGLSTPVDDLFEVTPGRLAAAHDLAAREIRSELEAGRLVPDLSPLTSVRFIGVGHSMGGMALCVLQARHSTFEALAVLGHGGDGLPALLNEAERAVVEGRSDGLDDQLIALARERARRDDEPRAGRDGGRGARRLPPGSFFGPDVPRAVRDAFLAQQTVLLETCGLASMIPSATDGHKASIDVPLFLAFGDHDLSAGYRSGLSRYSSVRDATLVTVVGSGHCHNQSSLRIELWERLGRWAGALSGCVSGTSP
jgi:pimeloyl-ACP methyl ester carboxylesterase